LDLIEGLQEPYVITIHAVEDIDYDDVRPSDLYIKLHDAEFKYPFLLISNDEVFTMPDTTYSYDLPYPSESLFTRYEFSDEEKKKYKSLYETFNILNLHYFEIVEEEQSILGGHYEDEFPLPIDGRDWVQFLNLSSYSHTCDFFEDIGDCHVSIYVEKNSAKYDLDHRVFIGYT